MWNPHRFDVIQKSDPKAKKHSLATAWDEEPSLDMEPVVHVPEPVVNLPETAEHPGSRPG